MPHAVLVSDFDGTMTADDFYKLTAARLLPPDALTPWQDYRAGRITHFTALQTIFSRIRATEQQLLDLIVDMRPDPQLATSIAQLRAAGWEVVVASAGCDWYIDRLLAQAGITVEIHANPCTHAPDGSLNMQPPTASPFYCNATGVDKAAIVRFQQDRADTVAFAGDGFADLEAALLANPALRFAKADLASALTAKGEAFCPFATWSDVAQQLLAKGGAS